MFRAGPLTRPGLPRPGGLGGGFSGPALRGSERLALLFVIASSLNFSPKVLALNKDFSSLVDRIAEVRSFVSMYNCFFFFFFRSQCCMVALLKCVNCVRPTSFLAEKLTY